MNTMTLRMIAIELLNTSSKAIMIDKNIAGEIYALSRILSKEADKIDQELREVSKS